MIDVSVFSSWMTLFSEHFNKPFSPTLVKTYHKQLSPRLNNEQFQSACEQVLMDEKFFPPLQTFIDYGKPARHSLSDRTEYQLFLAPAPEDPAVLEANRKKLAAMVEGIGKPVGEEEVRVVDEGLRLRCERLTGVIQAVGQGILRNEAIRKAVEFAEASGGKAELITAHDGSVHGVRPATAKVIKFSKGAA